jgi:hypothetical protein
MSHNEPPRHHSIHDPEHAEAERARDERIRDPYEAQRPVRTFGDDRPSAATYPWDAAHGHGNDHFPHDRVAFDSAGRPMRDIRPSWSEQPARYGGGYRADQPGVTRQHADGHRSHQRGWDDDRVDHTDRGQSNSGYDTRDADNARLRRHAEQHPDAAKDPHGDHPRHARAAHGGDPSRGWTGAQDGHQDTYGSAGYRQQGKRYRFDEAGDTAGRAASFRGVRPRNYVRSDERLRELINEQLTDADLDASDIEVKVSDGAVTLEGSVGQRWMKHMAEDVVDACGGVTDIHNHLRVRRPGQPDQPQPGQPAATGSATLSAATPTPGADAGAKPTAGTETATPASNTESNRKH